MAEGEFTPEQLAEQIKALKVSDLLLSTVSTLGQLAYVKLDAKQLDEARLAIDSIAALLAGLEGQIDDQLLRDFTQLLANVRISYASAMSRGQAPGLGPEGRTAAEESGDGSPPGDTDESPVDMPEGQAPGHAPNDEG